MQEVQKFSYQIKTLSKVILSPRQQQAFYRGIDFDQEDIADELDGNRKVKRDINVIYPFYQKGVYQGYQKDRHYYIPGSSIKGAMGAAKSKTEQQTLMVNDIALNPSNLGLYHVNKVQNASPSNNKILKLDEFFPNLAIQMCKSDVSVKGELFSSVPPNEYFRIVHKSTLEKMKQWQVEIENLLDSSTKLVESKAKRTLSNSLSKLKDLEQRRSSSTAYFMILGGYKGLLLSMKRPKKTKSEELQSGIYLDVETCLPYGVVEISEVQAHV